MEVEYILTFAIRYINITLGIVAMWALWQAKRERGFNWTKKMRDIWLSIFIFVYATVQANIELLWRHVTPTFASYICAGVLIHVIRHSLSTDTYTTDQPRYPHNK